eukprot:gene12116-12201_t
MRPIRLSRGKPVLSSVMDDSNDMFGDAPDAGDDTPTAAELEAAGQSALFGDPAPAAPAPAPAPASAPASGPPPRRLFAALLAGDGRALIDEIAGQYALGIEPVALMRAQMDLVHKVTLAQVAGSSDAPGADERAAIDQWARTLGAGPLHRLWQLLLKGYDEVRTAPDPLASAQMALLRVMHAADMPDPGGLVRQIEGMLRDAASAAPAPAASAAPTASSGAAEMPVARVRGVDWATLVEHVEATSPLIGSTMRLAVRVIDLVHGHLRYELAPGLPGDPSTEIRRALEAVTGAPWQVERTTGDAAPSLEEARVAQADADEAAMHENPLVKAVFAAFPEARIVNETDQAEPGSKPWSRRA